MKFIIFILFFFLILFISSSCGRKDTIPPDTTITSYPQNLTNSTSARFEFVCNEKNCTFECRLDNRKYSSCSSPKIYNDLPEGIHTFYVRAIDSSENIDETPAYYSWRISIPCHEQLIFFDDMESGTSNWIADSPWGITTTAYSGSYAWADSPAGNYPVNKEVSLKSIAIKIPQDLCWREEQSEIRIEFKQKYFIGKGDSIYFDVSSEFNYWDTMWRADGPITQSAWIPVSVPAGMPGASPGGELFLSFILSSDLEDVDDGWFIDDVRVFLPAIPSLLWSYETGESVETPPVIMDIDNDGKPEVVIGSLDFKIYAFNGEDGSILWSYKTGGVVRYSPAIADINNDGTLEIIAGSWDHNVYALNGKYGSLIWSYRTEGNVYSSPSIGDIDNDGKLEVVILSFDGKTYALNGEDGSLLWSCATGEGISSPLLGDVDNDASLDVIIGSEDGKIYALDPNGSVKWGYQTGSSIDSSPAIGDDGTVYVGSTDGKMYAIKPDGNLKWQYRTFAGIYSSPVIASDGTVYVGSYDYNLYAFKSDGTLKWTFKTGSGIHSSPAIASDGTIYVGSFDNKVYAIKPDGNQKWVFQTSFYVYSSPAVGADGTIYIGGGWWKEGKSDGKLYAIGPDGTQKWIYQTDADIYSSPAIGSDGTIYIGSNDSRVYAVRPDGSLKWSHKTGGPVHSSPAIGADGLIYIGSDDNMVYALNAQDGSPKWSYQTGDDMYSSPAIGADGAVYIASRDGCVYAFLSRSCMDNSQCSASEYCQREAGKCNVPEEGVCTSLPTECPNIYEPVCGCNGMNYTNSCYAAEHGVNVNYQGACVTPSTPSTPATVPSTETASSAWPESRADCSFSSCTLAMVLE